MNIRDVFSLTGLPDQPAGLPDLLFFLNFSAIFYLFCQLDYKLISARPLLQSSYKLMSHKYYRRLDGTTRVARSNLQGCQICGFTLFSSYFGVLSCPFNEK